jgi:hypothetical protein
MVITNAVTGQVVGQCDSTPFQHLSHNWLAEQYDDTLRPATLDGLTLAIEGEVSPEGLQILLFGRVTAHKCRRGDWCDWTVLGRSAVCTIGGEIASVGTDGEIAKLEVAS